MNAQDAYSLLADPIRRVLWDLEWEELRAIQVHAIELVLKSDCDLIISARTASGKTEAAFLPVLSSISDSPVGSVRALYVGPLRALINDQFRRLETLCERAEIPVHRRHGDVTASERRRMQETPGGVLLITPESLEAMFVTRSQSMRSMFRELSFVVIDELHAMDGTERGTHLRSLLARLDLLCSARPRLIGLSATLGNPELSKVWLRPDNPAQVSIVQDSGDQKGIRYGIFTFMKSAEIEGRDGPPASEVTDGPPAAMAAHMYEAFKRDKNLLFANQKAQVEWYADELNQLAKADGRPGQFLVHHGSLSKDVRENTEQLMQGPMPFSTVCTSTLELGIDIGNVAAVGQIGCPWSVASLVQRLGRSGRRDGQPQVMQFYLLEDENTGESDLCDRLRPQLLHAIALTELMLEKWTEPPKTTTGDLSTLVQQILSLIAEIGGVSASLLFQRLIQNGAFRRVPQPIFVDVLRSLGRHDLIEQTPEGYLILGIEGEKIVSHYDFYSAFATPPEYQVSYQGESIGMLPTVYLPNVGDHLLLAGRRWRVTGLDHSQRDISVQPAKGRKAPLFTGSGGSIHDRVRQKMYDVLCGEKSYPYVSGIGDQLLNECRKAAQNAGLNESQFVRVSPESTLWFPWLGTNVMLTLSLLLEFQGVDVLAHEIALQIKAPVDTLHSALERCQRNPPNAAVLAELHPLKRRRKYDWALDDDLLNWSIAQDVIDIEGALAAIANAQ